MKENKGITLVALIITIIVLLILAVVTISAVNEGSLFSHANNAAKAYSERAEEENTLISSYIGKIEEYTGESDNDRILELMRAAYQGDQAAYTELMSIVGNDSYIFQYLGNESFIVFIYQSKYYYVDNTTHEVDRLTSSMNPTLYEEVRVYEQKLNEVKTIFMGNNLEDFEQMPIDQARYTLSNLGGTYITELNVTYYAPSENNNAGIQFRVDPNQSFAIDLELENGAIENIVLKGKVIGFKLNG